MVSPGLLMGGDNRDESYEEFWSLPDAGGWKAISGCKNNNIGENTISFSNWEVQ